MKTRTHGLDEREKELVKLLMAECETTGDIQAKLKKLFAGTIEQMLEVEMDEHLGYEKIQFSVTTPATAGTVTEKRPFPVIMVTAK